MSRLIWTYKIEGMPNWGIRKTRPHSSRPPQLPFFTPSVSRRRHCMLPILTATSEMTHFWSSSFQSIHLQMLYLILQKMESCYGMSRSFSMWLQKVIIYGDQYFLVSWCSKLINVAAPGTIDERAINTKRVLNPWERNENHTLCLNSAKAIGCTVINIGTQDLVEGRVSRDNLSFNMHFINTFGN